LPDPVPDRFLKPGYIPFGHEPCLRLCDRLILTERRYLHLFQIGPDNIPGAVWPLPTANAGSDISICLNDCVDLTASGGVSYSWSTGDNTAVINVCPTTTTNYAVTVTDANGCSDSDNVIVTVMLAPTANAGPDVSICLNDCTDLTATGGVTYLWNTGETNAIINVCPTSTETYTVTVTVGTGCSDSDDVTVTVMPVPTADAGSDVSICLNDCTDLIASGGSSYLWNTGGTMALINVCPSSTETYIVTVTNNNGCTSSDDVIVTVIPFPVVDAGSDATICENDSLFIDDASAIYFNSITWSASEGHFSNPNDEQTYYFPPAGIGGDPIDVVITLTATANPPCTNQETDTRKITVLPALDKKDLVGKPFPENGHPVVLITTDSGYVYQWYIDGIIIVNEEGQFYYKPGGLDTCKKYMVEITNDFECSTYSNEYIYCPAMGKSELFIAYPNPAHGRFSIKLNEYKLTANFESCVINIYDVSGKIVYQDEIVDMEEAVIIYNINKGIYFIEAIVPGIKSYTKKIIIY